VLNKILLKLQFKKSCEQIIAAETAAKNEENLKALEDNICDQLGQFPPSKSNASGSPECVKEAFAHWSALNQQRYIQTSHHIHFTLEKSHDTFKLFMQIFIALTAFFVAVFSGKFGIWINPDQICKTKESLLLPIIGIAASFIAYLLLWGYKHYKFRGIEHSQLGVYFKGYDKPKKRVSFLMPLIVSCIVAACFYSLWTGLGIMVNPKKCAEATESLVEEPPAAIKGSALDITGKITITAV